MKLFDFLIVPVYRSGGTEDGLASDAARFLEMNPGPGNNWRASWGSP